ncbi:MAG: tetratricopeptide repeat protein [Promethearchaeota archaeon]
MAMEIQETSKTAENFIKQKNFEGALSFLKKSLEKDPKNAEIMIMMGYVHTQLNFKEMSPEDVAKISKKALELNKKSPLVMKYLGILNLERKEYDKAIRCYTKAIDLDPDNAEIWFGLGKTYQEKNKISKAIESYTKAVELDPDLIDAWDSLANIYELKNDDVNAINIYKQIISLIPDSTEDTTKEELNAKKIENYRNILSLDPYNLEAWEGLALIYGANEEYEKALVCYEKATEIAPYDIDLWLNVGNLYAAKKDYESAIEYYEKAINLAPDHAIRKNIPLIKSYKKVLEVKQDDINIWMNMGYAYEYNKEYDEALNCYEKALEIDPNNSLARYKFFFLTENKE